MTLKYNWAQSRNAVWEINLDSAIAMTKLYRLKRYQQGPCLQHETTSGRVQRFSLLRQATASSKHFGKHASNTRFSMVNECNTEAAGRPVCDFRAPVCLPFIYCGHGPYCALIESGRLYFDGMKVLTGSAATYVQASARERESSSHRRLDANA